MIDPNFQQPEPGHVPKAGQGVLIKVVISMICRTMARASRRHHELGKGRFRLSILSSKIFILSGEIGNFVFILSILCSEKFNQSLEIGTLVLVLITLVFQVSLRLFLDHADIGRQQRKKNTTQQLRH